MLPWTHRLSAYEHYAFTYYKHLPHLGNCAGDEGSAVFGCALLTSYLGLFINFYFQTYKKPVPTKANGAANGHVNGHANGKANGSAYVFYSSHRPYAVSHFYRHRTD